MSTQTHLGDLPPDTPFRRWGFWAVVTGALALVLVFVQMSGILAEPAAPIGQQIGEIAGDIKRSAWRSFLGMKQPEPAVEAAKSVDVFQILSVAVPVLGAIAIILSLISAVMRENWRYSVYGLCLGASSIVFLYIWWMVLVIAGVMMIVAVIENLGDIFSF